MKRFATLTLLLSLTAMPAAAAELARAVFAGGCFWCMEAEFEDAKGVASVVSGFTGGTKANPTYEDVSTSSTGHAEAVELRYDPAIVSYEKLLDIYWSNIDPTDAGGQFADRGSQYRTAIYTTTDAQASAAKQSKAAAEAKLHQKLAVEILPAGAFFPADEYHQHYAKKNPVSYLRYKYGSGRPARLKEVWGSAAH